MKIQEMPKKKRIFFAVLLTVIGLLFGPLIAQYLLPAIGFIKFNVLAFLITLCVTTTIGLILGVKIFLKKQEDCGQ